MDKHSYIGNMSPEAIDELYSNFQKDPNSLDAGWKQFFSGFDFARARYGDDALNDNCSGLVDKEFKVINLINGYRSRGHLFTKTNPVRERRTYVPTLEIQNFELEPADLDTVFQAGNEI